MLLSERTSPEARQSYN